MIALAIFLGLVIVAFVLGNLAGKRRFKSILRREKETRKVPVLTTKTVPAPLTQCRAFLVSGNIVVTIDFIKRFLSLSKALIGGRLSRYESLLDLAHREAILRMKESAILKGGIIIFNVRIETTSIRRDSTSLYLIGSVEVVAYGTSIAP
jgi:uncharacterized protein YbjQ (UPF0145 family)